MDAALAGRMDARCHWLSLAPYRYPAELARTLQGNLTPGLSVPPSPHLQPQPLGFRRVEASRERVDLLVGGLGLRALGLELWVEEEQPTWSSTPINPRRHVPGASCPRTIFPRAPDMPRIKNSYINGTWHVTPWHSAGCRVKGAGVRGRRTHLCLKGCVPLLPLGRRLRHVVGLRPPQLQLRAVCGCGLRQGGLAGPHRLLPRHGEKGGGRDGTDCRLIVGGCRVASRAAPWGGSLATR